MLPEVLQLQPKEEVQMEFQLPLDAILSPDFHSTLDFFSLYFRLVEAEPSRLPSNALVQTASNLLIFQAIKILECNMRD